MVNDNKNNAKYIDNIKIFSLIIQTPTKTFLDKTLAENTKRKSKQLPPSKDETNGKV